MKHAKSVLSFPQHSRAQKNKNKKNKNTTKMNVIPRILHFIWPNNQQLAQSVSINYISYKITIYYTSDVLEVMFYFFPVADLNNPSQSLYHSIPPLSFTVTQILTLNLDNSTLLNLYTYIYYTLYKYNDEEEGDT